MFKNSVFRPSVDTKRWFKATIIRCIKTMSEVMLASIGTAILISEVNWEHALSMTLWAGLGSFLSAIPGIPEVSSDDDGSPKHVDVTDEDV